jgi:ectoine hydroxylase-related dioxygenase (phytanoyl-CoA dioxygenase family)
MDVVLDSLTAEQRDRFKPVAIELKAGECSFHHPLMIHGSYANHTAKPRRAVVINAFCDGVVSASDAPLLEGVPAIPAGQKIEGQFFPLLSDFQRH